MPQFFRPGSWGKYDCSYWTQNQSQTTQIHSFLGVCSPLTKLGRKNTLELHLLTVQTGRTHPDRFRQHNSFHTRQQRPGLSTDLVSGRSSITLGDVSQGESFDPPI